MKFRLSLILYIFLLVVTPIVVTGLVTMQAAEKALQEQALLSGRHINVQSTEIHQLRENIVYVLIIGIVVSLTGAGIFTGELADSVNVIKNSLDSLGRDSHVRIPHFKGVMGEIGDSINQLAEALRETRNHRDALLTSSPNAIITVDRVGKVILFNPAASALTGIAAERALGEDYTAIGLPRPIALHLDAVLAQEKTVMAKEETFSGKSVAISTSPLRNEQGDLVGALELVTDLREKRLLEAQVLRANRLAALGELAAGVAHEIRNPLTAIKGYAQVLEEELPAQDDRREYTEVIVKEVNRLNRIVSGLLAFARPAQSRFERIKLQDVLEDTFMLVDNEVFQRRILLNQDYGPDIWLEADYEQIQQIILNLLLNATQAIAGGGRISIRTREEHGLAKISIADTGSGIPQENQDKLFDPFFTTKEKGTGLGLAIVHQLVELHRGKISVQSTVGMGTEFTVKLPLKQGENENV